MLRNLLLIWMLQVYVQAGAQNQVPNAGFENYINCPDNISQLTTHCKDWWSFTQASPDYFNACAGGNLISVPANLFGNEDAAEGNAYAGVFGYHGGDYREYLATRISALTPGGIYEVSMYVSLADKSTAASDGLGVYFYKDWVDSVTGDNVLPIVPQVSYKNYGIVTERAGWVRLKGYFMADSSYTHMVIGNFNDDMHTLTTAQTGRAYYYFDSVAVSLTALVGVNYPVKEFCAGDTIQVSFISYKSLNPDNMFSLELSDSSGSFEYPVVIGSVKTDSSGMIKGIFPRNLVGGKRYRLRLTSSSPVFSFDYAIPTIQISPSPQLAATANRVVCEGTPVVFNASAVPGVSFRWTGPSAFVSTTANAVIEKPVRTDTGIYNIVAQLGVCRESDTVHLSVKPRPSILNAVSNSPLSIGDTLKLSVIGNEPCVFNWWGPSGFHSSDLNPIIPDATINATGVYMVTAAIDSCMSDTTALSVLVGVGRKRFLVFPNPTHGRFRIIGTTTAERVDIAVCNVAGQTFYKTTVLPAKGIVDVMLPGDVQLAAGVYFVNIRGKELDQQVKVVVD